MRINFFSYYLFYDGYGRFAARLVEALQRAGDVDGGAPGGHPASGATAATVDVRPYHLGVLDMPDWLLAQQGIDWSRPALFCCPPYMVKPVPSPIWLYSMTEGTRLPDGWADTVNAANVQQVIVPCRHNAQAFQTSGVQAPIAVVPGGTDPTEFPLSARVPGKPYTFLTFTDRNQRKGWHEVWEAFYAAFGGKTSGVQDVRLILKSIPGINVTEVMAAARDPDPRLVYDCAKYADPAALYAQADCLVLPSRSEGWGMIHREAAMMGLPVITQAYSGLDDGHTHEWALVVEEGKMQPIDDIQHSSQGEWRVVDIAALAGMMRRCYEQPRWAADFGRHAAAWLRANQAWEQTAEQLLALMRVRAGTGEHEYA